MAESPTTRVDVAAVLSAAQQYDAAVELVDTAVQTRLLFDGATAGRSYVADGDAVRNALGQVVEQLSRWSRAAAEIAAGLRSTADRFVAAEALGAQRFG